jgi:hypothetical protein
MSEVRGFEDEPEEEEGEEKEEDIETPLRKGCTGSPFITLINPAEAPGYPKKRVACGMSEILASTAPRVDNPAGNGKTARRL